MSKKKDLKLFGKIILVTNCFFVSALLIAYLSPFISPEKVWMIAFFGLAYPLLLLVNVVFMLYWFIRRRILFLLSFLTIIAGWKPLSKHIQFFPYNNSQKTENTIKILSYNVRNFDLYNYNKDWSFNFENRNKIFEFIKDNGADIICLQEIVYLTKGPFRTIDSILKIQKANQVSLKYSTSCKGQYFGMVTFSRFPIINQGEVSFVSSKFNSCIYSDIKVNNDTFRVYNVHLESIHLEPQDIQFAEEIGTSDNLKDKNLFKKKSKRIVSFLKKAFIIRAVQARSVRDHIAHSPYPVILCGDFNDTPLSYAYHTISDNLDDAFVESGFGLGKTYITTFPMLKIDFILHGKQLESYGFHVSHVKYSDHYPVECYIKKKE